MEKWSKERLTLKRQANGSCEAVFKYEGTTCSNMGHKLVFNYYVKLSSPIEGYRIISLNCRPADDGYKYMCGYLKDEQILDKICNDKPLLGKQLEAVLKWVREFRPEACYCDSESRTYKWGMVYETLHFVLVTQEKNV